MLVVLTAYLFPSQGARGVRPRPQPPRESAALPPGHSAWSQDGIQGHRGEHQLQDVVAGGAG